MTGGSSWRSGLCLVPGCPTGGAQRSWLEDSLGGQENFTVQPSPWCLQLSSHLSGAPWPGLPPRCTLSSGCFCLKTTPHPEPRSLDLPHFRPQGPPDFPTGWLKAEGLIIFMEVKQCEGKHSSSHGSCAKDPRSKPPAHL
jgi:hypothetical protein